MQLKPTKHHSNRVMPENVEKIIKSPGKFVTEPQLAEILGLNVQRAVIRAAELKLSRIHIKKTRYYSKKQIMAYLNK